MKKVLVEKLTPKPKIKLNPFFQPTDFESETDSSTSQSESPPKNIPPTTTHFDDLLHSIAKQVESIKKPKMIRQPKRLKKESSNRRLSFTDTECPTRKRKASSDESDSPPRKKRKTCENVDRKTESDLSQTEIRSNNKKKKIQPSVFGKNSDIPMHSDEELAPEPGGTKSSQLKRKKIVAVERTGNEKSGFVYQAKRSFTIFKKKWTVRGNRYGNVEEAVSESDGLVRLFQIESGQKLVNSRLNYPFKKTPEEVLEGLRNNSGIKAIIDQLKISQKGAIAKDLKKKNQPKKKGKSKGNLKPKNQPKKKGKSLKNKAKKKPGLNKQTEKRKKKKGKPKKKAKAPMIRRWVHLSSKKTRKKDEHKRKMDRDYYRKNRNLILIKKQKYRSKRGFKKRRQKYYSK